MLFHEAPAQPLRPLLRRSLAPGLMMSPLKVVAHLMVQRVPQQDLAHEWPCLRKAWDTGEHIVNNDLDPRRVVPPGRMVETQAISLRVLSASHPFRPALADAFGIREDDGIDGARLVCAEDGEELLHAFGQAARRLVARE